MDRQRIFTPCRFRAVDIMPFPPIMIARASPPVSSGADARGQPQLLREPPGCTCIPCPVQRTRDAFPDLVSNEAYPLQGRTLYQLSYQG
jgi:hypothetical protein